MIFDKLDRYLRYAGLQPALVQGLEYLSSHNLVVAPLGRIDLQGDALFALVQEYTSKSIEQGVWEAHRRYIDIQYIVSGRERIFFAPLERMQLGQYVPEKDFLPPRFLSEKLNGLTVSLSLLVYTNEPDPHASVED